MIKFKSLKFFTVAFSALSLVVLISAAGAEEPLPWQSQPSPQVAQGGVDDSYRGGTTYGNERYQTGDYDQARDVYRSPANDGANDDAYRPGDTYRADDAYRPNDRRQPSSDYGYGAPYEPPRRSGAGEPYDRDYGRSPGSPPPRSAQYEQGEVTSAGHRFFGSISKGLASAVEYVFRKQGRPNGYILGEDAGGAFIVGLRYGEGTLFTKDAGDHKIYWQGPSVGYDAGAEGSKAMVLVYNMRDISDIYHRFGGVQGSVYIIGGVGVQFQKYGDVTLAVIRSGVGLRLGANVGYLKYSRSPTWNPL